MITKDTKIKSDFMNELQGKTFKDYLSDIGISGIVHLALPFTGLITLFLITKFLGVSDYGIYTLALATAGILSVFVRLSFPSGLVRFLPGEKDKKVISASFISTLAVILLAGAIIFLFVLGFSDVLATKIFHDINAKIYLYIIALTLIFDAFVLTLYSYFRILEQVKRYLKYEVLFTLARIGLMAAAVLLTGSLLYVFLALLLNSMVNTAVLLFIFLKEQGWSKPDFKIIKPYLAFCLPLIVPQIMVWVIGLSDRYFISYFWGTKEVGIYSAAYSLALFVGGINNAIWFVFMPMVARLWNTSAYEETRRYFTRSLKLFVLFGVPATFGLIILANPLLSIISTAEIGQESWKVVPFVCLSLIGYVVYGYGADIYLLQRRTRPVAYFMTTAAVVNTIGNFLLIPKHGILGAAIATLLAYLVMAVISMGSARRFFTFPVEWTFIAKALLASMMMSIFLWFFHPIVIWEVILSIFLGATIYFAVLFLLKGFNRQEIEFAKGFLTINRRKGVR